VKIVCTIEGRMGSTRRPGKTMAEIMGRPMLELLVERLQRVSRIDQIVLATTTKEEDQCIEDLAHQLGVGWFRGSNEDVLDRVLKAAGKYKADWIVELCGDGPLVDWDLIDRALYLFDTGKYDYISNMREDTWPIGVNVQLFPFKVLAEVAELTQDPADREHVSLYIYEHPERYRLCNIVAPPELHRPDLRLVVDTEEDLTLMRSIFERLYPKNPAFTTLDVIRLLDENPELVEINASIQQKSVR